MIKDLISTEVNCYSDNLEIKEYIEGGQDIESLRLCIDNNWNFMLHTDYHGKAIKIDNDLVAIGSANLTTKGYDHMIPCDREETGIIKELSEEDEFT